MPGTFLLQTNRPGRRRMRPHPLPSPPPSPAHCQLTHSLSPPAHNTWKISKNTHHHFKCAISPLYYVHHSTAVPTEACNTQSLTHPRVCMSEMPLNSVKFCCNLYMYFIITLCILKYSILKVIVLLLQLNSVEM